MAIAELSACMKEKEKKIMRKVKKAAGILLALTLAASLVTGCGGSSSKAQEEKDTLKQCKQLKSCLRDPGEI